jgi:hypothetical protein
MILIQLWRRVSDFLVQYKGLPVLIGIGLVVLNFVLRLLPAWPVIGWLAGVDLFLHLGIIIGLFGILLGDAL